jgi:PEGA domain-containing protein
VTTDTADLKTVASFPSKPEARPAPQEDLTFEFVSEAKLKKPPRRFPGVVKARKPTLIAIMVTLGVLAIAGGVTAALALRTPAASTGSLSIETDPAGAEVRIDDAVRGMTPLTLSLPEGRHRLVVRRGSNLKEMDVDITSSTARSYHVEWADGAPPAAPTTPTGSLSVVSDSAASTVIVDGTARGQTPLTIHDLAAGRHEVLVRNANATFQRSVQVEAGTTTSLVVGGAPAGAPSWGWITVETPFPIQILEAGRVVGTSEIDRVMLSPGQHELDFVSEQFEFRQSSVVNVSAGRGGPVSLTIPRVGMNINASPWAEVYVDGVRIGDTPLANVQQPIGDHEIVFRHPQLGEKRQVARLTVKNSPRISVDMRSR